MRRRDFLKKGAAFASAVVLPSAADLQASAATVGSTLVIAAPATPQSLDCNFDGSLGT
jgi:peptide/nickel transport system substrate-binding protein